MSQITKTAKSTMIIAAGAVAGVLFAGSVATPANAETVYFGYETSFREAKQMCNGMHGRIFETERAQYGCTGLLREQKEQYKRPPTSVPRSANSRPGKRQNFSGRDFSEEIGKVGGEGNGSGGGGGGGNGGGSAGGTF